MCGPLQAGMFETDTLNKFRPITNRLIDYKKVSKKTLINFWFSSRNVAVINHVSHKKML